MALREELNEEREEKNVRGTEKWCRNDGKNSWREKEFGKIKRSLISRVKVIKEKRKKC